MLKSLLVITALTLPLFTHAADKKIGNVIAVERQVDDLYATCLKNVDGDITQSASFFSCVIPVIQKNELSIATQRFVREFNSKCMTEGTVQNGRILITFGAADHEASFNEAKTCLAQGLMKNNSVTLVVYTVE